MFRGSLIGLSLVACSIAAIIGGSHHLAKIGQESVLRAHANATAAQWVTYIEHSVHELAEIASGAPLSNHALMFFAHGIDTSAVTGYRLYDNHGEQVTSGGAPSQDAFHLELSKTSVAAVLASGMPRLEMDIHNPAHDHVLPAQEDHAHHSAHGGMDHGDTLGSGSNLTHTMPVLPISQDNLITSYFSPIFVDNRLAGVLEIELDHNVIAGSLASAFRSLSLGLTAVLALAVAPPLLFGWHKSFERRRAERTAHHLAFHDPLTHLPNRRYAYEEIEGRLKEAVSGDDTMALLCLDLDGFKSINDTFGHAAGDDLLRQVTGRLTSLLGSGDILARPGGDEFLIIPKLGAASESIQNLAQEIIESICNPFEIDNQMTSIGVSIGIVLADKTWRSRDQLLRAGDVALYEAKAQGRRRAVVFQLSMEVRLQQRRELENDLRLAVARDELVLHYQPQFDVSTMVLTGFEALVRWQHPTRGLLLPGDFIRVAEDLKLIDTISRWVMRQACQDAASWSRPLKIAVNISAIEFEESNLMTTISEALALSGLDPLRLEIEITETTLMSNTDVVVDVLNRIRDLGVSVAMDDFGTGYSSLGYLCKFPFDKLKIDRSFLVSSSNQSAQSQRIILAYPVESHSY